MVIQITLLKTWISIFLSEKSHEHQIAPETESPAYTRTSLAQSLDWDIESQHRLLS